MLGIDTSLTLRSFYFEGKALLRQSLQHHQWLLLYVAIYILIAAIVLTFNNITLPNLDLLYTLSALLPGFFVLSIYLTTNAVHHLVHHRDKGVGGFVDFLKKDGEITLSRIMMVLVPALTIPFFASYFTAFKIAIPQINPFQYDPLITDLERVLHFGKLPWEWLHPILGYPIVSSVLSFFYNLWLFVMYGVLWWQILSTRNAKTRLQFLIGFVVIWSLLGNGFAVIFSSVGPVYFEHFYAGPNPYLPLMEYLQVASEQYPNFALMAQDYLWMNYQSQEIGTGAGISAMPSLHLGVCTLQACIGWRHSRALGVLFTTYALLIFLGSVHLGWHYAIDGYFSILLTILIWKALGRFLALQK